MCVCVCVFGVCVVCDANFAPSCAEERGCYIERREGAMQRERARERERKRESARAPREYDAYGNRRQFHALVRNSVDGLSSTETASFASLLVL